MQCSMPAIRFTQRQFFIPTRGLVLYIVLFFVAALRSGAATEYSVVLGGDDASDGPSRAAAFATIQRGVNALEAGDTFDQSAGRVF